jgi:hypothetical protein
MLLALLGACLSAPTWTSVVEPGPGSQPTRELSRPGTDETVEYPEIGLKIRLPKLDSLDRQESSTKGCKGSWIGRLGSSEIRILFHVPQGPEYEFAEAEDVVESWRNQMLDPETHGSDKSKFEFSFGGVRTLAEPCGYAPILALVQSDSKLKDDPSHKAWLLIAGGLLADGAWSIRIEADPAPSPAEVQDLTRWMETCVTYEGKVRDPRWSDQDAQAFFKAQAPESLHKHLQTPVRTEHFIVLTDSTSFGTYVKKLEGKYATIRKALPFEEIAGRRLLPVLLFRTDAEFQAYYRCVYKMEPKAEVKVGSFVVHHCMVTSCENRDDYEDLFDLTKLVLIDRVRAWGGDRWFKDGLCEYVASKPKERAMTVTSVKMGAFTPIEKLMDDRAWDELDQTAVRRGLTGESDYWEQSAMWIEFLRDGGWPGDSFPRLLATVGGLRRGDQAGVKAAVQSIYGMDLKSLQRRWLEYFAKRK